jgi:chloramphenicol 3-O-phosphotransferase
MNEASGLDGAANEGFNADISLVRPASVGARARAPSRLLSQTPSTSAVVDDGADAREEDENTEAELLQKATQRVTGLRMRYVGRSKKARITKLRTRRADRSIIM